MARAGDKLGRHPTQSREKDGKGKQGLNHLITDKAAAAAKRQAWETSRQRQPRAKSGRETSLGDKLAAAAKSEIMKGDKLGKQGSSGSQERRYEGRQAWGDKVKSCEIMKGDKLGKQGGSGSQERRYEGRQAWGDKVKSCEIMKGDKLGDKATAAAKSEIMKGDKLGRQAGSGGQERNHEGSQNLHFQAQELQHLPKKLHLWPRGGSES